MRESHYHKLIENNKKIIVFLFFLGLLLLGLAIFRDYGVHWDEFNNQACGNRWFSFIRNTIVTHSLTPPRFLTYSYVFDWTHGPAFEIFLATIQKILKLDSSRDIIFMRHLCVFLLFYVSVYFFYLLNKRHFKSWKLALLGCVFLVLSPRIFADAFYNSFDAAFLSFYIISIYTLLLWLDKKTFTLAAIHAVSCAILIDIRPIGLTLPVYSFALLIAEILRITAHKEKIRFCKTILLYILLLIIFVIICYPLLWANTLSNLIIVSKWLKNFHFSPSFLYLGRYITAKIEPWHYAFVWVFITTPIVYSFCFLVGCFASIKAFFKNSAIVAFSKRNNLLFISWFFLPLIAGRSRLYDGWRHLYFTYPAFLIFSSTGLMAIWEFVKIKFSKKICRGIHTLLIFVTFLSSAYVASFMIRYHPYQNVYFNMLAARNMEEVKKRFELDYWGLSYRKALEYILHNDNDRVIKVFVANTPGNISAKILTRDCQKRLVYVNSPDEAKYFLSNYRWHPRDYPYNNEFFSIKVGGAKIMVVYKLK